MVAGHFATALLAREHAPAGAFAFYLVASQLPDLLWQAFHFVGLEPTHPDNPMLMSLDNMEVQMTYSHDVLPMLVWTLAVVLVGRALFGSWRPGLAGGALMVAHLFCDYLSGHPHHVYGPETPALGLGLYASAPYFALVLEAVFTVAVLLRVRQLETRAGRPRSLFTWTVWSVVLLGGVASLVPNADLTLVELTGWEPLDALTGTLVPGLVLTYLGMMAALLFADRRSFPAPAQG